jgi:hypothetical protein
MTSGWQFAEFANDCLEIKIEAFVDVVEKMEILILSRKIKNKVKKGFKIKVKKGPRE